VAIDDCDNIPVFAVLARARRGRLSAERAADAAEPDLATEIPHPVERLRSAPGPDLSRPQLGNNLRTCRILPRRGRRERETRRI